jgi:hypothetical protein
MLALQVL